MRFRWLISAQCPFRMPHSIWIAQTVRHREASWSVSLRQHCTNREQQPCHPCPGRRTEVKRSVSASLAGEVFMMSEGLAESEWISGVLESTVYEDYEPSLHRRKSISLPVGPTVTAMKADSHLQIDPSTACVIDAKSAFDHLVREPTGGHCRPTAQELCVIRRSMQTLRARCRWVPHERMVVDALTKRHGNSVTMLRLLRDVSPVNRGRRSRGGDEKSVP